MQREQCVSRVEGHLATAAGMSPHCWAGAGLHLRLGQEKGLHMGWHGSMLARPGRGSAGEPFTTMAGVSLRAGLGLHK